MILSTYRALTAFLISALIPAAAAAQTSEQSIDDRINDLISPITQPIADGMFWGPIVNGIELPIIVVWLFAAATIFTVYMGFINIRGFKQALRIVSGKYDNPNDPGEVTHFQALSAALSGTVGLGNIAGVAIAISIGGPGATFWMILAGLLGMSSKFVECTLGVKYRQIDANGVVSGGPMYYLSAGLAKHGQPRLGKFIAAAAAIICIGGAFGSGAMFQTNQATQQVMSIAEEAVGYSLDGSQWIFGLMIAAVMGVVIIGGIKRIARVTEILVPVMAIIYATTALLIILANITEVPAAFGAIFDGAFSNEGVAGGFIGVLVQGIRRAAFSNEAGIGSAPIAHAAAKTTEPVAEGMVALLEPFVDTVVICTLTALVIIITGYHLNPDGVADGISLTSAAFESVFPTFRFILTVAVVLFAFSTSITWFYYGQRALIYLFGDRKSLDMPLKISFLATVVIGSGMSLSSVVDFADAMILGMAFPNIVGLYILAPEVKRMLKSYLARIKSGEISPYSPAGATVERA